MAYSLLSVPKQGTNPGGPADFRDFIVLFRMADVETFPEPDALGVVVTSNLVLKASAKAIKVYITPSTLSVEHKTEGDLDSKGFTCEIKGEHPGDSIAINEFLENNINENMGAIVVPFSSSSNTLLCGNPAVPLQFTADSTLGKDGKKHTIDLKSTMRTSRSKIYKGALPVMDEGSGSGW